MNKKIRKDLEILFEGAENASYHGDDPVFVRNLIKSIKILVNEIDKLERKSKKKMDDLVDKCYDLLIYF